MDGDGDSLTTETHWAGLHLATRYNDPMADLQRTHVDCARALMLAGKRVSS